MKKLKNPLDTTVSVIYMGKTLSLEAGEKADFLPEEAEFWLGVHPFLVTDEVKQEVKEEVKEEDKSAKKK
jgi:hypothetical protein